MNNDGNSGRMQTAAVATGDGTPLPVSRYGGALMWLRGISGDTVTWEASMDGSTWYAIRATPLATGTIATTATADGLYFIPCPGVNLLRGRISTYGSGTINLDGQPTLASGL